MKSFTYLYFYNHLFFIFVTSLFCDSVALAQEAPPAPQTRPRMNHSLSLSTPFKYSIDLDEVQMKAINLDHEFGEWGEALNGVAEVQFGSGFLGTQESLTLDQLILLAQERHEGMAFG